MVVVIMVLAAAVVGTTATDVPKLCQALQLQQETLELRKRVLPADHCRIAANDYVQHDRIAANSDLGTQVKSVKWSCCSAHQSCSTRTMTIRRLGPHQQWQTLVV